MRWDLMTSSALAATDRATPVLLPLGATEQHGPHLPLCTDRMLAEQICSRVDEGDPGAVLVLPTVQVGCSAHHLGFPGTLSLRHETFARQVVDVVDSVVGAGFRTVVLLNGHGGNQGIGAVLLELLGERHPDLSVVFTSWWQLAGPELLEISDTGPGGVGHACELETSMMLAVAPELVDTAAVPERSGDLGPDWNRSDMLRGGRARLYRRQDEVAANGVHGDPRAATAEKGRAALDAVVEQLRRLVGSIPVKGSRR